MPFFVDVANLHRCHKLKLQNSESRRDIDALGKKETDIVVLGGSLPSKWLRRVLFLGLSPS